MSFIVNGSEKPCVGGSIPPLGTIRKNDFVDYKILGVNNWCLCLFLLLEISSFLIIVYILKILTIKQMVKTVISIFFVGEKNELKISIDDTDKVKYQLSVTELIRKLKNSINEKSWFDYSLKDRYYYLNWANISYFTYTNIEY